MGHEAAAAAIAWNQVLSANSTLTGIVTNEGNLQIFAESAPQDAVVPYVVGRQRSPGSDSQVLSDFRAMSSPLIDIGVWVADDPYSAAAQVAAKQIDVSMNSLSSYAVTDANGDVWEVSARSEGGAWVREEFDKETKRKFYWVGRSYRLSISQA
jgi:hypothetical protein